ncbi:MAG: DNA polymerase III subunit alpha, partial [Firmicutes bacterium]|nr:DNA polymerase III subunit alpha [Bacillota bacterium]
MPFTHLHVHTEYSLLDGAIPHKSLFKRCGELGMGAVAMTDHGNMYGTLKFDAAAMAYTHGDKIDPAKFFNKYSEYKVKPIFGCEFYLTSDMSVTANTGGMPKLNHLILLAKDLTGYHNLVKLNSAAFLEGFYYKPRIDKKLLRKHADGLVCLSACLAGEIPQALLKGDFELAVKLAEEYKGIFAPGDFYVELQDHGIDEQRRILPLLAKAASLAGVKAVATNDAHYLRREDAEAQRVLQCISYKTTLNESSRGDDGDYFPTDEFYLKSGEEMEALFKDCPEAAAVTAEIADKCSVRLEYEKRLLPGFTPPDKTTPADYLRKLTIEGLRRKYKTVTEEIRARAEHELEIIENSKFVEYFLIVYDFIRQAESTGVSVGPGRGSGVGSIVAYATGITKVDPIKYGLYFERFLNAERVSMPDFDIDFCIDGRASVIEYVVDKYGKDNVAQIITFGTLSMKSAVKDVGRVLGYGYAETDRISKAIPFMMDKAARLAHVAGLEQPRVKPGAPVPNFVIPEVKQLYDTDEAAKRIIDMAIKLEGLPRNPGMHAAGVVICCDPISNHVPLQMSRLDVTTQFDKKEVEKLGLLKMDFLGLRTLTDIKKALDFIKRDKGIDIDFYNME